MKFLHLADLHIGKLVNEFSMLEDQRHILTEVVSLAVEHAVDAVVLAGDLYDRSVPPAHAVTVLDHFLCQLHDAGIPVFAIAGNHDSAERLDFARTLLERQGVTIVGRFSGTVETVTLYDADGPVHFYLLPFVKPATVAEVLQMPVQSTQQALAAVIDTLADQLTPDARHVLVTHQFVSDSGRIPLLSDSEVQLSIGGVDAVDAALFDKFQYTALGHLHTCQQIGTHQVYYAGSPLKYSKSEAFSEKSALLVSLDGDGAVTVTPLLLHPLHDLRAVRGTLAGLTAPEVAAAVNCDDYLYVTLTDEGELIHPMGTLRSIYPNTMAVEFSRNRAAAEEATRQFEVSELERLSPMELMCGFYQQVTGREADVERTQVLAEALAAAEEQGGVR